METPKKILIADDDAGIVDAIRMILDFEGYTVSVMMNGADVLKLSDDLPDLLLLDIWMSGEDGREVCKQLKRQPHTKHLPVLMISASNDIEQSAREAGADDFVAKPFEMDDLLGKIESLLKNT